MWRKKRVYICDGCGKQSIAIAGSLPPGWQHSGNSDGYSLCPVCKQIHDAVRKTDEEA